MSKDTTFVVGTIVEAEWLNELQEVETGLVWGLNLNQLSSNIDRVSTAVTGDPVDTRSSIIIGGQRRWLGGPSADAIAGGASGPRKIVAYVDDDDDLNTGPGYPNSRNFSIEVIPVGNAASGTYSRTIGYADWDAGGSTLSNIRLANGVQADANQSNSFTFQTVGTGSGDIPITIAGKTTQDSDLAKMLSIGADDGGGYNERFYVSGSGLVSATPDAATDIILRALISGDTQNRFQIDGNGVVSWGTGAAVPDVELLRGGDETLRLDGATNEGIFDTTYFQNSNITSAGALGGVIGASNFLSPVNFMDDVYISGVGPIDLTGLAHLDTVETFTAAHTFAAQLNMDNSYNFVFIGNGFVSQLANSAGTNIVQSSAVTGDTNARFSIDANGRHYWGSGSAAADVEMYRGGVSYLEMNAGDQIRVQQDPVNNNDLARKLYVDTQDAVTSSNGRAFAFFIGR